MMPRAVISFFLEDIDFKLKDKVKVRLWLKDVITMEGFIPGELNFIFCSDEYLLKINREYLNHDTYTDIITFDSSEQDKLISGDIFISVDRVTENAGKFNVSVTDELHRVMVHGTLHLLGYPDKGTEAKKIMTSQEDKYLEIRKF